MDFYVPFLLEHLRERRGGAKGQLADGIRGEAY
jgi:hypothetical protein